MFPFTRRVTLSAILSTIALSIIALSVSAPLPSSIAKADGITEGALTIQQPWARATVGSAKVGALYLTVRNSGAEDDQLIGVVTDVAAKTELHISETSGDMMTMRPVEAVAVPAGGAASFAPQGAHIMLIGLKQPLKKGTEFTATLRFASAGDVAVTVKVQGISDMAPE